MERTAQCHCGQLRVIATGEPNRIYVCHCKACQRRTGAVVHSGSRWLKSQVRIEGEHKIYARMADSGFESRFHFCPNCGSNLFWEGDRTPEFCGITVGSFADPDFPRRRPRYGRNRCIIGSDCRLSPIIMLRVSPRLPPRAINDE